MEGHGRNSGLLTVEQAAERLSVKPRYIRHLLQQGRLRKVKLHGGRLVRIESSELEAFLARSRESSD